MIPPAMSSGEVAPGEWWRNISNEAEQMDFRRKTTTMLFKMLKIEDRAFRAGLTKPRQLFVTQVFCTVSQVSVHS